MRREAERIDEQRHAKIEPTPVSPKGDPEERTAKHGNGNGHVLATYPASD